MDKEERIRKIMIDEFGISTVEELQEAINSHNKVDLGIFITPYEEGENEKSA